MAMLWRHRIKADDVTEAEVPVIEETKADVVPVEETVAVEPEGTKDE